MVGYLDQMNYGSPSYNTGTVMPVAATMPTTTDTTGVAGSLIPQAANAGGMGQVAAPGGYATPQLTGWQKFGYVMDGIGSIGGLWGSIQQNKIAKQQLALSREAYNTNMNNTIQSYNTQLADRIRARYIMEGRSEAEMQEYIEKNSLSRSQGK